LNGIKTEDHDTEGRESFLSELSKRILLAVPAAALTFFLTWMGGWYLRIALVVLILFIQYEMQNIAGKAGFKPDLFFLYLIGVWILFVPVIPYAFETGVAIFLLFVAAHIFRTHERSIQELFSTIFCAGYASFGLLFLLLIRNTAADNVGFKLTISLFLMIWANDICAYFGGKYQGKHSLASNISPNKTWEGVLYGFLGSVGALLFVIFIIPPMHLFNWWILLPSALVVSIFSTLGDLAESKLKRAAGVKDASGILPGHGGFLDRMDGMILAAPAFYLYLYFIQTAGYVSF
jgi:phosphatidate cytidylyltransferase